MIYSDVLSIRPFRNLWFGQAISQLGDALYYLSFPFMVARISGSPTMVGYVGAFETLPYLLFSPYAGVLADRLDRKKIMLLSDLARAILLILLGIVVFLDDTPHLGILFGVAFLLSSCSTFFGPARGAAVPALVPEDKLMTANSLSNATQSLMPLIGLGLSGGLLGAIYALFPNVFFLAAIGLNALSFLVSAYCITTLPPLKADRQPHEKSNGMKEFIEGAKMLANQRTLLIMVVTGFFVMLLVSPFFVVYITANNEWYGKPAFAGADVVGASLVAGIGSIPGFQFIEQPLKANLMPGSYTTIAFLELAFIGGMFIGSLLIGKIKVVRVGVAFALNLAFIGVCIILLYWFHQAWQFALSNFISGLVLPFAQIPSMTYTTLVIPDSHRGRVNSVAMMANTAAMPLGTLAAGFLVASLGIENMFLLMGSGFLLTLPALLDPQFRGARMPEMATDTQKQTSTENLERLSVDASSPELN